MRYLYKMFHKMFPWISLILVIGALSLGTSALAGGTSAGSMVGKLVLARVSTSRIPSMEIAGTPVYPLAYVDPGAGQLIWQMMLAGCVGALFYVKRVRSFLSNLIAKWLKRKD